ncbi:glycosyltransferase [Actinacidiphila oryziradicis]|uniref:Glycosyltransferase family 2 protein n=1 Tax=Actinacidiphila oryziradicis TaxID=2571141 RepID=A0A4U0T8Y8_9ACTN|nr:glycosyltransferase family 2 protein [Actinacidiphila oryziradicis]TKA12205.1 glycosyltransferase family 2 protein [Actinacidiphila oryziradicis]
MIRAVAVVVPAHDEQELLDGCLRSVRRAAAHPALRAATVRTFVIADSCRDATAEIGRRHGAEVVEAALGSAGAARALGSARALARLLRPASELRPQEIWLAHTDADTRVPACWLAGQLDRAAQGIHAVVGTVEVDDWSEHLPGTAARFRRYYAALRDPSGGVPGPHPHVHGANLALRADAYAAVGGFPPVTTGEDRALVAALESAGCRVHRTDSHPVRTSARRASRAPGGFGDFLRALEARERWRRPAAASYPPPVPPLGGR